MLSAEPVRRDEQQSSNLTGADEAAFKKILSLWPTGSLHKADKLADVQNAIRRWIPPKCPSTHPKMTSELRLLKRLSQNVLQVEGWNHDQLVGEYRVSFNRHTGVSCPQTSMKMNVLVKYKQRKRVFD